MGYEPDYYGIELVKDILICCDNCDTDNVIEHSDVDRDAWNENAPMGVRIEYLFNSECHCISCMNRIEYSQRVSEYPEGCIEYTDFPECVGGMLLTEPEFGIPVEDEEIYFSNSSILRPTYTQLKKLERGERLSISIQDGDGYIDAPINVPGRSTNIWINPAGRLLSILVDETGSIRFDGNKAVFAEILSTNPNVGAMKLLGKVAEAVLVRNCAEDRLKNRIWLTKARKIRTMQRIADQFQAIGTGLHSTKNNYPQKYSPSDPQRDIIWINETGEYAMMSGVSGTAGTPAGLQVKVSGNGVNYLSKSLRQQRYEVPLIYFPINNDYERVVNNLLKYQNIDEIAPGVQFIDVREVDQDAFLEIKDYYPILMDLFTGRLSADDFVDEASGITPIRNGIMASVLSENKMNIRILH